MDQARQVLRRLLTEQKAQLPRPAAHFLEKLLADEDLLSRMRFCRLDERHLLRNSVMISVDDTPCWGVMLGNEPDGSRTTAQARSKLALEGLDLTPDQVLERLRPLPVWFLALDEFVAAPPQGEAPKAERTRYAFSAMSADSMRRLAILDQIDAALDAGDREGYERLRKLL
jgi:hypothetical protein